MNLQQKTQSVATAPQTNSAVIDDLERIYGPISHLGFIGQPKALCGYPLKPDEAFIQDFTKDAGPVCSPCFNALFQWLTAS